MPDCRMRMLDLHEEEENQKNYQTGKEHQQVADRPYDLN